MLVLRSLTVSDYLDSDPKTAVFKILRQSSPQITCPSGEHGINAGQARCDSSMFFGDSPVDPDNYMCEQMGAAKSQLSCNSEGLRQFMKYVCLPTCVCLHCL